MNHVSTCDILVQITSTHRYEVSANPLCSLPSKGRDRQVEFAGTVPFLSTVPLLGFCRVTSYLWAGINRCSYLYLLFTYSLTGICGPVVGPIQMVWIFTNSRMPNEESSRP
jgi:hypothetical protein